MNAKIASIERHRFEIDGTGIRTLIVFSGCPLECKFCINSYTWKHPDKSLFYSTEELVDIVSIDNIYFEATHGGITFGGGEPLLQSRFIAEFISKAPKTWNYVVETSLAIPFENIEDVVPFVSNFVVDIKTLDENTYEAYTGKKLGTAFNNLVKLKDIIGSERIKVRVPKIQGYVDELSQQQTVNKLIAMGFVDIDIFEYRVK